MDNSRHILTLSNIRKDYKNGSRKLRNEANSHLEERSSLQYKYSLSVKDIKTIFSHPNLKGLRRGKKPINQ